MLPRTRFICVCIAVTVSLLIWIAFANASGGQLDPGFGTGGLVAINFDSLGREVNALALQPDGKIVAAGYGCLDGCFDESFALVRYTASGAPDPNFGQGGVVTTNFYSGSSDRAQAVVLQPDGKIVAAGYGRERSLNENFALARYNSDGSLDTSFGDGGKVITDFSGSVDSAQALILQFDGKLIAAGFATNSTGNRDFALVRYNADGTLDTSFGAGGKVTTHFPFSIDGEACALVLQPDGKLLAGGFDRSRTETGSFDDNFALARYNSNGSLDTSFGQDGKVITNFGGIVEKVNSIVLQADGKVIAAGYITESGELAKFALTRYNPNGTLDASFGTSGKVTTDFSNEDDTAYGIVLQSDGKIVVAGSAEQSFALARYKDDGTLDSSFGVGGKVSTTFSGLGSAAHALVLQPDGKLIAGGYVVQSGGTTFALARYYTLDPIPTPSPSPTSSPSPTPTPQQRPLIFIPGIAGSRLDNADHVKIWPPMDALGFANPLSTSGYTKLSLNPASPGANIIVPDVIRFYEQASKPDERDVYNSILRALTDSSRGRYREYRVDERPERRTVDGCDLTQQSDSPSLFVFAYDWRKSDADAAAALKDYVQCIQRFYPNTDIDIVAHSQGGLVARRYILDNPNSHHVKKVITVASPWLGAPKAINVLETGRFLDPSSVITDGVKNSIFQTLSEFYPGVHELVPSSYYFDNVTASPYNYHGQPLNYDQTTSLLDQQFPVSRPGTNNRAFHGPFGQDDWSEDTSNVEYHHLYGIRSGSRADTVGTVVQKQVTVITPDLGSITYSIFDIIAIPGDGTVPVISARRNDGLNAPGVSLKNGRIKGFVCSECNEEAERAKPVDHTGLMRNPDVIAEILSRLHASPQTQTQASVAAHAVSDEPSEPEVQPAYYLRIIGAASASIEDSVGNSTNPLGDPPDNNVSSVTSYLIGEKSFLAILPIGQTYTVTLRADTHPLILDLTEGTDTVTTRAIRYQDVSLPAGVTARLQITPQGVNLLQYDREGDGVFEATVTPTVSVSGTAAQDTTPPTVVIGAAAQGNSSVVTITSSDSSSGVKATYFSLNGVNYQRYTSPFMVNQHQAPAIYAFSDDNVGNRSGLVTHRLISLGLPVLVSQPTSTRAVALDSVLSIVEPFRLSYEYPWGTDRRTRINLFALNFELSSGENASAVTATAEDVSHRIYPLTVEYVGKVPNYKWINSIVLRLNDELGEVGDVLVRIKYRGVSSNPVRIGIGHVGGGPPDP